MADAPYDAIAGWYDRYVRERPLYRALLLPALLELAGDAHGQTIADLACGQGLVSRALAQRGARVTGVDIAANLLELARHYEAEEPLGIVYLQDDAQVAARLPGDGFDGVTCSMALMLLPDLAAAFATVRRLLRPGGWYVFAITHPCFQTPRSRWLSGPDGAMAREVRGYFDERFWTAETSNGVRGQVGEYHRTLGTYLNTLSAAGLALERVIEPRASAELVARDGREAGQREVPSLLLARAHRV